MSRIAQYIYKSLGFPHLLLSRHEEHVTHRERGDPGGFPEVVVIAGIIIVVVVIVVVDDA